MLMKINYSLVFPSYNEGKNLESLFQQLEKLLADIEDLECIIVDNGSTDHTEELIKSYAYFHERTRFVRVEENQGYGYGILEGVRNSNAKVVSWMHADLQTNPLDIKVAIELWEQTQDVNKFVKGKRVNRNLPDQMISVLMSVINFFANGNWILDINSQPNMLPKEDLLKLKNLPYDNTFEIYILNKLISEGNFSVYRFPVKFHNRKFGVGANERAKDKFKYAYRIIKTTIQMRKNVDY
jgi:glycosyltransferase involved in cell wall biosynthesis